MTLERVVHERVRILECNCISGGRDPTHEDAVGVVKSSFRYLGMRGFAVDYYVRFGPGLDDFCLAAAVGSPSEGP